MSEYQETQGTAVAEDIDTLHKAFKQFNASASELEQSYRLLQAEVGHLKQELSESHLEKERLREEVERNHRLAVVGEMATKMAHELRNPLGSIELFAGLLKKALAGNPGKQLWADHLKTAVASMDYAITNLLLFTGKPHAECRKVDLAMLIEGLHPFIAHRLKQNQIDWENQITAPQSCWCDEDLMRQVLLNLIINAIDAMPRGGCLRLSAETSLQTQAGTIIVISDTGTGMPKESIPHIFDPFFTTKKTGTGLGLSIVQNAVAAHDGSIQVESSEQGSRFTLHLPSEVG